MDVSVKAGTSLSWEVNPSQKLKLQRKRDRDRQMMQIGKRKMILDGIPNLVPILVPDTQNPISIIGYHIKVKGVAKMVWATPLQPIRHIRFLRYKILIGQ